MELIDSRIRRPIKESRRLRIVIGHKKRTLRLLDERRAVVQAELSQAEADLAMVLKAESAVSA